jgi:dihydroneopterin aldolase
MGNITTSQEILLLTGTPHSVIRVTNLKAYAPVGTNAWGNASSQQPVLISAAASLRDPFATAATDDKVDGSTIHYGVLSKGILAAVANCSAGESAIGLLRHVERWLVAPAAVLEEIMVQKRGKEPVLDVRKLRALELEVCLPKASLLGSGVSVFEKIVFSENGVSEGCCTVLKVQNLKIPTLVGVNAPERRAKQIVVANVELEKWTEPSDKYAQLEELVVKVRKTMRASISFMK